METANSCISRTGGVDPCFVNAEKAAQHLSRGSAAGFKAARVHILRARALSRDADERGKCFAAAVYDWWRGNERAGLLKLAALAKRFPGDDAVAGWALKLSFNLGDAERAVSVTEAHANASDRLASAWGLHALALEFADRVPEAEQAAKRGLRLSGVDPWCQLAMAHVFHARGQFSEGARFLSRRRQDWLDLNPLIRRHLFWQLALFHLLAGQADKALGVFDRQVCGVSPASALEQVLAISFLWQLELQGYDAGGRWRDVADRVEARWHEHVLPINDLHFIHALARDGRMQACKAMLASMERRGAQDNTGVWDSVVVPAARAIIECAEGRVETGRARLVAVLPRLHLAGGSRVQRDVFERVTVARSDSLLREAS